MAKDEAKWPVTVDAAVRLLRGLVPEQEQSRIAFMPETELETLDFGLGMWVRNNLGLWSGNTELLIATGHKEADEASAVILRAFWSDLRNELPKVH